MLEASVTSPTSLLRLGLLGDLHGAFDGIDAELLDAEGYARILFVGDLGPGTREADRKVARAIARLRTPVMVMPGNNDCETAPIIRAELGHQSGMAALLKASGAAHRTALLDASAEVEWCGYGSHALAVGASGVTVLSGRPYAMGGGELSYAEALRERYGIESMQHSTERLVALVEAAPTEALVFLAHNGPTGLGDARDALWGRDFLDPPRDHGDPDLRAAIDHARALGKRVLGVVAGHMHHRLRGGGERRWLERHEGILYVNPARLPRIVANANGVLRHHVTLTLREDHLEAEERWLEEHA